MPVPISDFATQDKNKLGSENVWLQFMEISYPNSEGYDYLRIVKNHEKVNWAGYEWLPVYFELEELGDQTTGEMPHVNVNFSNVDRFFQTILTEYDTYCKLHGVISLKCWYYIVNSGNLASSEPEVSYEFLLKEPKTNNEMASFTLGGANMFNRTFPSNKVLKNHCRFEYKGIRCQATSTLTTCNKTLSDCRDRGNSERFGGFPSVGYKGLKFHV